VGLESSSCSCRNSCVSRSNRRFDGERVVVQVLELRILFVVVPLPTGVALTPATRSNWCARLDTGGVTSRSPTTLALLVLLVDRTEVAALLFFGDRPSPVLLEPTLPSSSSCRFPAVEPRRTSRLFLPEGGVVPSPFFLGVGVVSCSV
jgi:hypothetical protein